MLNLRSIDCGINPLEHISKHTQYFLMELTDEPVSILVSRLKFQCEVTGEVEFSVSRTLLELEMNSDLMAQLWELNITMTMETEVVSGHEAFKSFVPVPQLKSLQKIQVWLTDELKKKLSGKPIVVFARRKILPKQTQNSHTKTKQKLPRRHSN